MASPAEGSKPVIPSRSGISLAKIFRDPDTDKVQVDPGFFSRTSFIQIFYGVWVNLSSLNWGLAFAFSPVAMVQLFDKESDIKITISDEAWITGAVTLTVPAGCIISGILLDTCGRKNQMIIGQVPTAIGWLITGFAKNPATIIIGRLFTGFGLGFLMTPVRVYITEISLPNMRGPVGAFANIFMSVGISLQTFLGAHLTWRVLCYISTVFTVTTMVLNVFLPDTPFYVLLKSDQSEAILKSIKRFRARNYQNLESELKELIDFKRNNVSNELSVKGKIKMVFSKPSLKPFCLILPYMFSVPLVGVNTFFFYIVEITKESKTSIDEYDASFILSMMRLIGAILSAILLCKIGRRPLALSSCIGCGLSFIYLGCYLKWIAVEPSIQSTIFYSIYVLSASLGYYCLVLLVLFELLPLQARGILGGVAQTLMFLNMFIASTAFPYIRMEIGLPNIILIYGCNSLLFTIYLYIFLPETKRLTLQEIENFFKNKSPTLTSQRDNLARSKTTSSSWSEWVERNNTEERIQEHKEAIKRGKLNDMENSINGKDRKDNTNKENKKNYDTDDKETKNEASTSKEEDKNMIHTDDEETEEKADTSKKEDKNKKSPGN